MTPPPRDGNRDLQTDEIMRIRSELDKRTAEKVAKAEKVARGHAERAARDDSEKETFLGMLFGKGKR